MNSLGFNFLLATSSVFSPKTQLHNLLQQRNSAELSEYLYLSFPPTRLPALRAGGDLVALTYRLSQMRLSALGTSEDLEEEQILLVLENRSESRIWSLQGLLQG